MGVTCSICVITHTFSDICVRTVTFHALVYQPVEKGATVVTERRAGVSVDLKLVFTTRILQRHKHREEREVT